MAKLKFFQKVTNQAAIIGAIGTILAAILAVVIGTAMNSNKTNYESNTKVVSNALLGLNAPLSKIDTTNLNFVKDTLPYRTIYYLNEKGYTIGTMSLSLKPNKGFEDYREFLLNPKRVSKKFIRSYHLILGDLYNKNYSDVIDQVNKLTLKNRFDKSYFHFLRGVALMNRGFKLDSQKDFEPALQSFLIVNDNDPDQPYAHAAYGMIQHLVNQNFALAVDSYQKALKIKPNYVVVINGQVLLMQS